MTKSNLLEVNNLSIHFPTISGRVEAVAGLSFHLKKGETLGVVGASGSGKSVTCLSIMGLLPKKAKVISGEIAFYKKDGTKLNLLAASSTELQSLRGKEMAMVFQEPMNSLNPVFRCGGQIMEAILLHEKMDKKCAKDKTLQWLARVQLDDPERAFRAFPHQLSGGQRQRVMIAMALACNPSLLIADEPTSALDVTVQRSILNLLKNLRNDWDGSILFVSHDLAVVAEIADRVVVMKEGYIVEQGPVNEVFTRPVHPYTKQLLADFKGNQKSRRPEKKNTEPLLKVKNLRTWFSSNNNFFGKTSTCVKAVDGVSFDLYEGETLGLVGESGSGKTTLGRTLLHLQKPTGGEVVYNGRSLLQVPDNQWKNIRSELQIIFQDPFSSLNPRQMIGPAIMEPMKVHGITNHKNERKERALGLLRKVGLEESHFWRFPKEFSGGQRQRICIARALAVQPRFLICDECVSALDVIVQSKILELLRSLQEEQNLTYLFISHDLSVVRQICDRIAVMHRGRIVEMGKTEDVFANPLHAYTRQLLRAIPKWKPH